MALPNLLIVGAAKSGTTSLHNYLNQHPSVFMCSPKEPHFLINKQIGEQRIPKGVLSLEDYKSLFKGASTNKYRGESSVMYLLFPEFAIKNKVYYASLDLDYVLELINDDFIKYNQLSKFPNVKRELISYLKIM